MYQRIILAGNLGRDPEMKFTPDGKAVTTFTLATAGNRKGEASIWFRVTVWDKQAETAKEYLHKGAKVLVEGRLQSDSLGNPRVFERKDGTWASAFEVTADSFRFLDSKGESASEDVAF